MNTKLIALLAAGLSLATIPIVLAQSVQSTESPLTIPTPGDPAPPQAAGRGGRRGAAGAAGVAGAAAAGRGFAVVAGPTAAEFATINASIKKQLSTDPAIAAIVTNNPTWNPFVAALGGGGGRGAGRGAAGVAGAAAAAPVAPPMPPSANDLAALNNSMKKQMSADPAVAAILTNNPTWNPFVVFAGGRGRAGAGAAQAAPPMPPSADDLTALNNSIRTILSSDPDVAPIVAKYPAWTPVAPAFAGGAGRQGSAGRQGAAGARGVPPGGFQGAAGAGAGA
jgi:hypothetical protein